MRLPNPERAVVEIAKLTDYCLNPMHEDGKHKARVFAAALGLAGMMQNGCGVAFHIAREEAVLTGESRFGRLYFIDSVWKRREVPRWSGVAGSCEPTRILHGLRPVSCSKEEEDEMNRIPLLAPVAWVLDLPEQRLTRGQMGTVVEYLRSGNEDALLVEFSDEDGQEYATAEVRPEHVIVLHRRDTEAA